MLVNTCSSSSGKEDLEERANIYSVHKATIREAMLSTACANPVKWESVTLESLFASQSAQKAVRDESMI